MKPVPQQIYQRVGGRFDLDLSIPYRELFPGQGPPLRAEMQFEDDIDEIDYSQSRVNYLVL
jgi:hypothetical protein